MRVGFVGLGDGGVRVGSSGGGGGDGIFVVVVVVVVLALQPNASKPTFTWYGFTQIPPPFPHNTFFFDGCDFRHLRFCRELLSGSVAPPPAARPLYEALEHRGSAADQHRLLSQGFRIG